MWHVGMHVWMVPRGEEEPDYEKYYAVRNNFFLFEIF